LTASSAERLQAGAKVAVRDRRGRTLRHLEIKRRLAQGAHNATYLARDHENERWVVVKSALLGGEDTELAIEERILLQLDSPHLVRLLGGGADARLHKILAYERLYPNPLLLLSAPKVRLQFPDDPGGRYCPLPPRMALALISDLFRGLAHLHEEGFVHHDVKLGNLLVAIDSAKGSSLRAHEILKAAALGQTRGVLIDFGAARSAAFLRELNEGHVEASEVPPQLTPLYAPPEALLEVAGRRVLLPSLDLYAAALVSYSLFCGRTPYEHLGVSGRDVPRLLEVKAEEQRGAELPINFDYLTRAPGMRELGKELFGFLSCCLSGDPSQRPSAKEASGFCEELQTWYHEALAASPDKPAPAHSESSAQPKRSLSSEAAPSRRVPRATRAKLEPALAETAEAPVEATLGDGFSTSAESAVSAQRLRDQGARAEVASPTPLKAESAAPEDPTRTRARPSQRAKRPRGSADRENKAPLSEGSQRQGGRPPSSERMQRQGGKPPPSEGMQRQGGKPPSEGMQRQSGKPPSEGMRRQDGKPPTSKPIQRLDKPPTSKPIRRQGDPPSERMQRQGGKPPTSKPIRRQGDPPSERMQRQGGKPPPSERMRQPGGKPTTSKPIRRPGDPPSERMQRQGGKPSPSERTRQPGSADGRPPSVGAGPRTPRRGLPALGSGPRSPRSGLPAVGSGPRTPRSGLPAVGSGPRTPRSGLPAVGSGPRTPRGGLPAVGSGPRTPRSGLPAVGSGPRTPRGGLPAVGSGPRTPRSGIPAVGTGPRTPRSGLPAVGTGPRTPRGGLPAVGSGPRTPRGGLPAVRSGPRTPRGGLPALDPSAIGLPEIREQPSPEDTTPTRDEASKEDET